MVLQALREVDLVAYVRFASVYREYQDVQQFVQELRSLGLDRPASDASPGEREARPTPPKGEPPCPQPAPRGRGP